MESYTYDADGNRVKKTVGSTNFYYPFATYEISGTVAIKYYYFNGQRVAMKSGSTLTYLHGDHLGSTVLETNSSGAVTTDERYFAYGKQRDTGKVVTDNRFTGQKEDGSGLQYFNARYYDPQTGLFVSPDTIVPDAGNVFGYNRSMYSYGNPLKFVDPSGHANDEAVHDSNDGPLPDWAKWHELSQQELDKAILLWLYDHQNIGGIKAMMGLLESYYGQTNAVVPSSFGTVYAMAYSRAELPGLWKGSSKSEAGFLAAGILAGVAGGTDSLIHPGEIAGGCSFNAKTLVVTVQGEKAIVSIQVGDKVLALNHETGEIGYYTVTDTHQHLDHTLVYLTIDGETILTTPEHPFFTERGEWIGAGELRVGSRVRQIDGDLGTVRKVVVVAQLQLMYNLTVAEAHTFVVGDGQWLVHNAGPCAKLTNGMTLGVDDAHDAATDFLGPKYRDMGDGRFLSADGTRQVRMGDTDILGDHGGGPHMNFESLAPNPAKPGKMMIVSNIHANLK